MTPYEAKAASSEFFDRKGQGNGLDSFSCTCTPARADGVQRASFGVRVRRHPGGVMKHWIRLATALAVSGLVAATVAALAFAGGTASGGARVKIARTPLGRILVDSKGITLYDFPPDKGMASVCYGACAALWPPLITHGKPLAGSGVRAGLLGTTKRKDGKLQVTYGGHPLYYFVSDRKPGQTTGQGVNQFGAPWWVISPAGKEIHNRG
jgi:predicted lipoprotein with Yx(FWY)xxD motif